MTSPGLKRPLDSQASSEMQSSSNGTKRRCTMDDLFANPASTGPHSMFLDATNISPPLNEHIASMINDELHRTNNDQTMISEPKPPVLTIRQTQNICEKVIQQRESKLRDEYEKILKIKVAELYELLSKANHLKSESRLITSLSPSPSNPSLSAMATAAAYSLQRRAALANMTPATTSLPNLNSLPAAVTMNGDLARSPTNMFIERATRAAALHNLQIGDFFQGTVDRTGQMVAPGPVLLVSNIDEQLAIPDALFTLFGVFGDVLRVKILFNKKDNALIQMADANQAQVAQGYLDKQRVYGKTIRVTRSKHQLVQMPRDSNQTDAGLTKDFTNSMLHRFKIPGSRNYQNIYPPSNTLHISNIPVTIDEAELKKAFQDACGFECSTFKFFPKDKKMALMKFNNIEHATIALIKMHNFPISSENNLRVSFSKSVIQQ